MAVTLPSVFRQVPRNLTYKKECVPETVIASDSENLVKSPRDRHCERLRHRRRSAAISIRW